MAAAVVAGYCIFASLGDGEAGQGLGPVLAVVFVPGALTLGIGAVKKQSPWWAPAIATAIGSPALAFIFGLIGLLGRVQF